MIFLDTIRNVDYFLFRAINQFAFKWFWFDTLGIFCAEHLEYILLTILFLFLLFNFRKHLKIVIKAIVGGLVARFLIVEFIRWLFPRLRPFVVPTTSFLVAKINQPAFPSGHASFYFAVSTIIYLYNKKLGILFFVLSLMIVLGRVFVGLHWPLDILVGIVVGVFSGWLINKIFELVNFNFK